MIERLVIVGLGDVTTRFVIPAVAELASEGQLPDGFQVVGVGRGDRSTEWLRDEAGEALAGRDDLDPAAVKRVLEALTFHRADATDADSMAEVLSDQPPSVIHLALPPEVFADAIEAIGSAAPAGSRLVVEKPIGTDAESAGELNELAHRHFDERDVIRVDHFLGERVAHNVLAVRFANRLLAPAWTREHVERVDIVWDETLALEGRAGYYDDTGAARDMLQNHLLQLLCLVAMEAPASFDHHDLADRKIRVLRSIRPWNGDPVSHSVRARYGAGEIAGEEVRGYTDEDDVDPDAETETYAEMRLAVDTPRWLGVPFTLRSGKALAADRHEITLRFRPCDHAAPGPTTGTASGALSSACAAVTDAEPNTIRLSVEPDEIRIGLCVSVEGGPDELASREVSLTFPDAPLGPYALLLGAALAGEEGYSVRADEAVEQWRAIAPILDAWERGDVPLQEYPAGSDGPEQRTGGTDP